MIGSISLESVPTRHQCPIPFLLTLATLFSANSYALNWESGYRVNLEAGYDDNFLLASSNEIDTSISKLGLFASAEGSSEVSSVQLLAGVNSDDYSDPSIDAHTTGNLSLSLSNQGERLHSSFGLSYLSEPTIETELLDTGILVDSTRDTVRVSPGMRYSLDERNSLSVNLSFTDVSYDTLSLSEYQNNSLSLGWGYRLDETSDFSTSLSFSRYEPDNADNTDTSSLSLGYNMRSTEATTYSFSVGYSDVEGPINSQTGSTYGATISNVRDERNSFSLTVAHSFQASGLGVVREEDRLGLGWTHAFSEKAQGVLAADFVGTDDRDYFEIQPSINYRLSENFSISANYRFRQQDSTAGDAESNSLLITLSYLN